MAELKTLVWQAFLIYNQIQQDAEDLLELIARLDPFIRGKIHEEGAENIQGVVEIVKNLKHAQEHYQSAVNQLFLSDLGDHKPKI